MTTLATHRNPAPAPGTNAIALPSPRISGGGPIAIRVATVQDIPFIDQLQKMHSHMVGWMPSKQLEAYVKGEHVLVAEQSDEATKGRSDGGRETSDAEPLRAFVAPSLRPSAVGYVIARDQYMKRDDLGIIYQLNVLPLKQRSLIGALLVKAAFERSAYGCKLFCCWCAQDIQANWFWESIGFIPLAFRTGSRAKQRIHIFWQRRVRDNDDSTPYWFPSQTGAGAVNEDRIVLPIPPGTHWRDAKPLVLPNQAIGNGQKAIGEMPKLLPGGSPVKSRPEQPKLTQAQKVAILRSQSKHLAGVPLGKKAVVTATGIKYIERTDYDPETDAPEELAEPPKPKRTPKPRHKNDPKYVEAARELRDRFLEEVNTGRLLPGAVGKYDVSRQIGHRAAPQDEIKLLEAA